jgi:hypothetical protein
MPKSKKTTQWISKDKTYDRGGIEGTRYFGIKLTGVNSTKSNGANSFYIMQLGKTPFDTKPMHKESLTDYKAYMQFKSIVVDNPEVLKKGKFKLNSNGTLPKSLLDLLGTDKISKEIAGVPTRAECQAIQDSWNKN